ARRGAAAAPGGTEVHDSDGVRRGDSAGAGDRVLRDSRRRRRRIERRGGCAEWDGAGAARGGGDSTHAGGKWLRRDRIAPRIGAGDGERKELRDASAHAPARRLSPGGERAWLPRRV